jgi:hypothetical protein
MAGRMQYASHANFGGGSFRDITRHLIPENGVFDASNVIITDTGSLSKRGATVATLSAASTIEVFEIGSQRSVQIDNRERMYVVGRSGGDFEFGSMQTLESPQPLETFTSTIGFQEVGRPSQFGDSVVFPAAGSPVLLWAGGADLNGAAEYSVAASVNTSIGNNVLSVGSTPASNMLVGGYVHLSDGGTEEYTGRITAVGSTTITVEPAPTRAGTFTQLDFYPILPQVGTLSDGEYVSSAGCVGVFSSGGDSRIVIGDLRVNTGSGTVRRPNRLMWAVSEAADRTVNNVDGLVQATRAGFPKRNFIDIEDIEQIIALVPIGSNNMLVVGTKKCVMLSGSLVTEADETQDTSRRGGSTVNVRQFAQQVGCVSPKSVQATSSGVMFAAEDGVYVTDGSVMINTMENKVESLYTGNLEVLNPLTFDVSVFDGDDVFDSTNSTLNVLGSANINDEYYYLSLTKGGFICSLRSNFGWTTVPEGQFRIIASARDAKIASKRVYALPFGLGTTSSTQKALRIDPVFAPLGRQDADGTLIDADITTKTYTEGDAAQLRRFRHMLISFELTVSASNQNFVVEEIRGFGGAGATSLSPNPTSAAATTDVRRYDIQIISQGIAYRIQTSNAPISFTVLQITNAYNALRPGRVK